MWTCSTLPVFDEFFSERERTCRREAEFNYMFAIVPLALFSLVSFLFSSSSSPIHFLPTPPHTHTWSNSIERERFHIDKIQHSTPPPPPAELLIGLSELCLGNDCLNRFLLASSCHLRVDERELDGGTRCSSDDWMWCWHRSSKVDAMIYTKREREKQHVKSRAPTLVYLLDDPMCLIDDTTSQSHSARYRLRVEGVH